MNRSEHASVHVDLARVRVAAERVRGEAGVDVIAVVKADAYGLGAAHVADAIGAVVDGFYVFTLREAHEASLSRFSSPILSLLDETNDPAVYVDQRVRPIVWTRERAATLFPARPVLSIDTGQQRFACPADAVDDALSAGTCDEALTHATTLAHVRAFVTQVGGRGLRLHAAGSALLDEPAARLDAVRPGLALFAGAARVSVKLVDARDALGPAGYGGFTTMTGRHGVVLVGYAHGLRPGPCVVNGVRRRVVEVGMQTAFVELGPKDRVGDEVILLGDGVTENDVATAWGTSPQEVLVRLCATGVRSYSA